MNFFLNDCLGISQKYFSLPFVLFIVWMIFTLAIYENRINLKYSHSFTKKYLYYLHTRKFKLKVIKKMCSIFLFWFFFVFCCLMFVVAILPHEKKNSIVKKSFLNFSIKYIEISHMKRKICEFCSMCYLLLLVFFTVCVYSVINPRHYNEISLWYCLEISDEV